MQTRDKQVGLIFLCILNVGLGEFRQNDKHSPLGLVSEENLAQLLSHLFTYPRNHNTNETAKGISKKWIIEQMELAKLEVSTQDFVPLQFLSLYEDSELPTGTNLIGLLKGKTYGTSQDRPTLVGAHWDTVAFTPGTDDNGSGVAAMLEVARALTSSSCIPTHSLIFVAFDLEEVGSQGSLLYIKDRLLPLLTMSEGGQGNFQGAFILDTIMEWNGTEGSQDLPREWGLLLPKVYDELADSEFRGDFLSMIYRKGTGDSKMAEIFARHWSEQGNKEEFKLQRFPLGLGSELPTIEVLADHINFLRSDHSRFWYMNDSSYPLTFPAVLMTDTGPYRGQMRDCYHSTCDGPASALANPKNLQFLVKTTEVLLQSLKEMSGCQAEKTSWIHTSRVHARGHSPFKPLLNFVAWMMDAAE